MKPGIKTSEFWLTVAITIAKLAYPDLPDEAAYTVIAYILSRVVVKATKKEG